MKIKIFGKSLSTLQVVLLAALLLIVVGFTFFMAKSSDDSANIDEDDDLALTEETVESVNEEDIPEDDTVQLGDEVENEEGQSITLGFKTYEPGIAIQLNSGGSTLDIEVLTELEGLDSTDCTTEHRLRDDKQDNLDVITEIPTVSSQTVVFGDGTNRINVTCQGADGEIESTITLQILDGQPELCKDFEFNDTSVTVSNLTELIDEVEGTWEGCATTPWTPEYWVEFEFKSDGTYYANSDEDLDGRNMVALYDGSDGYSSNRVWEIDDFQTSSRGVGTIDVEWTSTSGTVNTQTFNDIKLMGDKLSFNVNEEKDYRLYRVD